MGRGQGRGQGRGMGRRYSGAGGLGAGPGGACVCPKCGTRIPHRLGVPCSSINCPNAERRWPGAIAVDYCGCERQGRDRQDLSRH